MESSIERLPKGRVSVRFQMASADLQPHLEAVVLERSRQEKIPGFRPGHLPIAIAEQRFGREPLWREAAERAVRLGLASVIREQSLTTVGPAEFTIEAIVPGESAVVRTVVNLLPDVTLPELSAIRVEGKSVSVSDEDVNRTLEELRRLRAKERRVPRPAAKGDKLEVDLAVFRDGVPVDGGASKNHPIVIGESHHIPGFEDQLIGLAEGAKKNFRLRFPKEYHVRALAGQEAEFRVTVNAVYEIELPALTDEFAKTAGAFENLDALKGQLRANLQEDVERRERERFELAALDAVIGKASFGEIPDALVEAELDKMLHELHHEVERRGMVYADYLQAIKKDETALRKEFRPQAERRVKSALVVRKVAETHRVEVSEKELSAELDRERSVHQNEPELLKEISDDEYRQYLRNAMVSRKAVRKLTEMVKKA